MNLLSVGSLFLVAVGALAASPSELERQVSLKNWLPALWEAPRTGASPEGAVAATALPSSASHFIAVTPCRIVDTRGPDGSHGGPILTGGVARAFEFPSGPCPGIPAAAAYSINISVTGSAPGSSQFLTAYPAGTARPLIATMVFNGGQTLSNAALVPADGTGSIEVYASADTHVILDINGYIAEGVVTSVTAGPGLTGGGTGEVSVGIVPGGVGSTELGASAVTTGAIQDGAVSGAKIANDQVVRDVNSLKDSVTIVGAGGAAVTVAGSTITVNAANVVPSGTIIMGEPNDTTLIGAGYTEKGRTTVEDWSATSTSGAPSARQLHTAVWTGTTMIVWGGFDGSTPLNDGGQYDPAADSWSGTSTTGAPSGRHQHTAVWTGTKMIVWGGFDGSTFLNSGGQYDPAANSWSDTSIVGAASARRNHTGVWTGTTMIVWGGGAATPVNSGGQYDPALDSWSDTSIVDAPSARRDHTAIWTGTTMIVWGGFSMGTPMNTGAQYDPALDTWSATSQTGAPSERYEHTAIWTGTTMIVFGGLDNSATLNTGARYDPIIDAWTATTTAGASGRYEHTAVWTGTRMIVWGGLDEGTHLNSGGRWTWLSLYRKN